MVLIRNLEQWVTTLVVFAMAVVRWLRTGWKTPTMAVRQEAVYPLILIAAFTFLVVKLTPILQTTIGNTIQAVGTWLQNVFNTPLG